MDVCNLNYFYQFIVINFCLALVQLINVVIALEGCWLLPEHPFYFVEWIQHPILTLVAARIEYFLAKKVRLKEELRHSEEQEGASIRSDSPALLEIHKEPAGVLHEELNCKLLVRVCQRKINLVNSLMTRIATELGNLAFDYGLSCFLKSKPFFLDSLIKIRVDNGEDL